MAAPSPDTKEELTGPDDELEQPPTASPRRAGFAAFRRVFSRFASAFLILFLLAAAAFAVSPDFREKVAGFVVAAFDREAAISESVSNETMDTVSDKAPGWLPDGDWNLSFYVNDTDSVVYRYSRPDDAFVNIYESDASFSITIDTEDAEIKRDISINGNPSIMSIKDDVIILSWIDEELNLLFEISVGGAPDVADPAIVLKIAENLY